MPSCIGTWQNQRHFAQSFPARHGFGSAEAVESPDPQVLSDPLEELSADRADSKDERDSTPREVRLVVGAALRLKSGNNYHLHQTSVLQSRRFVSTLAD